MLLFLKSWFNILPFASLNIPTCITVWKWKKASWTITTFITIKPNLAIAYAIRRTNDILGPIAVTIALLTRRIKTAHVEGIPKKSIFAIAAAKSICIWWTNCENKNVQTMCWIKLRTKKLGQNPKKMIS